MTRLQKLGTIVKDFRESSKETQLEFATRIGTHRTAIAHLEQGRKVPNPKLLTKICTVLKIPKVFWAEFIESKHTERLEFEDILSELVGKNISLDTLTTIEVNEAEKHIHQLFLKDIHIEQRRKNLNRCLIFYGIGKMIEPFYLKYFFNGFESIDTFKDAVKKYQKDSIRVFSTFSLAYQELNKNDENFQLFIEKLEKNELNKYEDRSEWKSIENIQNSDLPYLGYIAVEQVKKGSAERKKLIEFIDDLVKNFQDEGKINKEILLKKYNIKKINKMDTLLRKFNTRFEHSLLSSLFEVDLDLIVREKEHLAPKGAHELLRMEAAQEQGFANLTNYLTADYMDLYVATSMRTTGDFVSVNEFIEQLFNHKKIKPLKLRYFNPTQSWIGDRVAKGLVEALMLKRADITIYMAQKTDTFGKDSEASVSLGQGKPVIVYVPKLNIQEIKLDSEKLNQLEESELSKILKDEGNECNEEVTDCDKWSLLSSVIYQYLHKASNEIIINTVKQYWAEFDLESETNRIKSNDDKKEFRDLMDKIKNNEIVTDLTKSLRYHIIDIFIAVTVRFERRAEVFKDTHPLALQVILNSGVLNGILVSRSLDSCANLLYRLLENNLELKLEQDKENYKLIEVSTGSVIRVISKNLLLNHAFEQFYTV